MAQCCVKIQQPSKPWRTFSDLCTSSFCLMKLTPQTYSMASGNQNPRSWSPSKASRATMLHKKFLHNPTHYQKFSTPRSDFGHMHRHDGLVAPRFVKLWTPAFIRWMMCRTYTPLDPRAIRECTRHNAPQDFCWCQCDIIRWCQLAMSTPSKPWPHQPSSTSASHY